jgi:hypothetical protein
VGRRETGGRLPSPLLQMGTPRLGAPSQGDGTRWWPHRGALPRRHLSPFRSRRDSCPTLLGQSLRGLTR